MPAVIFTVLLPALPIFIWKCINKKKKLSKGEIVIRYSAYGLFMLLLSSGMLAFLGDGTSFWYKVSRSMEFALKYVCMVIAAALVAAALEWIYCKKRTAIEAMWQQFDGFELVAFCRRYIAPFIIYGLAVVVVALNVSLMFDNVLWGDECFSANTAEKSLFGILQVMYYWDNHPPLHYYWVKLFGELFGFTVPVMHLASMVPFFIGIILAVTVFRKKFGNIPAAFFVMISGIGPACLEYNLEVRMYSLAFMGVAGCFYCAYRVISKGKRAAWIGMVLWALVAAYSHYYALVAVGIMLFYTGVAYWVKYRGKTWIKGFQAIIVFLIAYSPWMVFLFTATSNVSDNWWMTDLMSLERSINMVLGNMGWNNIIIPLWVILLIVVLVADSGIFAAEKQDEQVTVRIKAPSLKGWSDETYAMAVGLLTTVSTVVFAYLLCFIMGPVLAERYLYPLTAITILMLVIGSYRMLKIVKVWVSAGKTFALEAAVKLVFVVLLLVMFLFGLVNYKESRETIMQEDELTALTLETIGELEADVPLVSNGVKHLGWTVLYHYYPENEIINGDYNTTDADEFWYFSPYVLGEVELLGLEKKGYTVTCFGEMQIATYPFELYHMEKGVETTAAVEDVWTITQYGPREMNMNFYIIHNPAKGLIVVDGGWTEDEAYVRAVIEKRGGVVDAWILTHPHQDHIGAFNRIYADLQGVEVKEIYTVDMATPEECMEVAPWDSVDAYNEFLNLNIADLKYVYPGDRVEICGLAFDIYNAFDENVKELSRDYINDGSMMFEVTNQEKSFLFCADVGKSMSDYLLEKWGAQLQADYLQMGHHGYGGLEDDFYRAVAPSVAFFDAPDWMMNDTTDKYDNQMHAALMQSLGSEVVSFNTAPNSVVLE